MTAADRRGYERVLKCFYEDGKRHGAKTRLGLALGVSRQVVDRWEEYGIPRKYADDLEEITGLGPVSIWGSR